MSKKIKILLAEDEESLGKIISESLVLKGFEVIHCFDGEEAMEYYKAGSFDILILDVMMPKKDGFTLAKEIRQTNEIVPILFLTAKSQTSDIVTGFESGGNDYLKKPFSKSKLLTAIEKFYNENIIHKNSNDNLKVQIEDITREFVEKLLITIKGHYER